MFAKRAKNYKNLFDAETKLMRGRLKNGEFMKPFNPLKWGDAFTEVTHGITPGRYSTTHRDSST